MACYVSSGTLNSTHSLCTKYQLIVLCYIQYVSPIMTIASISQFTYVMSLQSCFPYSKCNKGHVWQTFSPLFIFKVISSGSILVSQQFQQEIRLLYIQQANQWSKADKTHNRLTTSKLAKQQKLGNQYLGHHSGWELFWITNKHQLCSTILEWNEVVNFCALTRLSAAEQKQ